jgi:arginase
MRNFAILEAPSVLGHIPTHLGVAGMPEALLKAGLAERIKARHAGKVVSPEWRAERDPQTQIMNPQAINDYSISLADAVDGVLDRKEFPVVIGGDCSILLGTMLALRRRGRYGVIYIDGHTDFYQAEANPILGAASASDLGFATGRGPAIVADIEGRRPLIRDDDVVVFGYRDGATQNRNRSQLLPPEMLALNRNDVRVLGTETAAEEAVAHLSRDGGPEGFGFTSMLTFWISRSCGRATHPSRMVFPGTISLPLCASRWVRRGRLVSRSRSIILRWTQADLVAAASLQHSARRSDHSPINRQWRAF